MTRWMFSLLALLISGQTAWAEKSDDGGVSEAVSMDWEGTPVAPPPTSWLGVGYAWGAEAQSLGGSTMGLGFDFTWVTQGQSTHHVLRFTHRTWRAPSEKVENRLKARGVTEGVQSYWAGRMSLSGLSKMVNVGKQAPHFGLQAGWRLQRTQHVGSTTQNTVLKAHDLYWGPQWTAHLGPEVHLGYYKAEETFRLTGFGRMHVPIYGQLNDKGQGLVINGKMWDPVETVAPEAEAGLSMAGRLDPYFVELTLGARMTGPSQLDDAKGRTDWQTGGIVDVALSKAF